MVDFLIQIPGPHFLLFYAGLALFVIWGARLLADMDGSLQHPEPDGLGPVAVADLRGGAPAVLRMTAFDMWNRDLLKVKQYKGVPFGKTTLLTRNGELPIDATPIERALWDTLEFAKQPGKVFLNTVLNAAVREHLEPVRDELRELQLLSGTAAKFRQWVAMVCAAMILLAVGGTKLYYGITTGQPFLFLAVLLPISLVVLVAVVARGRLTRLGRRYLKRLGDEYEWAKEATSSETLERMDPAMYVAVFGVAALPAVMGFSAFAAAFERDTSWSWTGGWLGGRGSGCGGAGCSGCGGGGCGGGCGGCGGD